MCSSSISGRTLIMHILIGVWWGCDVEGMIRDHRGIRASLYPLAKGRNSDGQPDTQAILSVYIDRRREIMARVGKGGRTEQTWVKKEALRSAAVKGGSCLGWNHSPQHQVTSLARACLPTPLQVSRLRVHRRCIRAVIRRIR